MTVTIDNDDASPTMTKTMAEFAYSCTSKSSATDDARSSIRSTSVVAVALGIIAFIITRLVTQGRVAPKREIVRRTTLCRTKTNESCYAGPFLANLFFVSRDFVHGYTRTPILCIGAHGCLDVAHGLHMDEVDYVKIRKLE
jgi:hypothetical protein